MYQRGAEKISETYEDIPENYQDLIKEEDFEKEGIENIRGKIYGGDPNLIFAEKISQGDEEYFQFYGIDEE